MKTNNSNKYFITAISGFFITLTFLIMSVNCRNVDTHFMLATGKYILEKGIPRYNPFTIDENLKIIVQQWLWDIIFYKIHSLAGTFGIYIFMFTQYLLGLFLYLRICRIKKYDIQIGALLYGIVFFLFSGILEARPTMITIDLLLWQILCLEKYCRDNKQRHLYWLIPIMILEVNIHSSLWLLHFIFLLPYIVPPIKNPFVVFKKKDYKNLPILCTMVVMLFSTLANPYGLDGVLYLQYSFNKKLMSMNIAELMPINLKSVYGIYVILILLFVSYKVSREKAVEHNTFYLFCGTFIMSCLYVRNISYFVIGALLFLPALIHARLVPKKLNRFTVPTLILCNIAFFIFTLMLGHSTTTAKQEDKYTSPIAAVEYLDEYEITDVRLYTSEFSGGYFEENGYKCFVDARPELFFKELNKKKDVITDFLITKNSKNYDKIKVVVDSYDFDYFCVEPNTSINLYLSSDKEHYVPVIKTDTYTLYKTIRN